MAQQTGNMNNATTRRVLVVGAGYGGLRTALRLGELQRSRHTDLQIVLLDMNDYHQLITELHEVAGGRTPVDDVRLPLADILKGSAVRFVQARVSEFDFANRLVRVEQRDSEGNTTRGKIPYRWLVMALGSTTAFYHIPGLREHAFTLKSAWEAERVHQQVVKMFAQAAQLPADDPARRAMLTFVVGGGGYTGVELAGELAEAVDKLCREYAIPREAASVQIVELQPTILPGYEQWMIDYSTSALQRLGVQLLTGDGVAEVSADAIRLEAGRSIATCTLVWVGGVQARQETQQSGAETGVGGRLAVNRYLQSLDYPSVYAIGDNGLPTEGEAPPPSAQVALQQADIVTSNIIAEAIDRAHRREAFKADINGEVISIGSRDGVAIVRGVHVTGFPAAALKGLVERRYRLSLQGGLLGDLASWRSLILPLTLTLSRKGRGEADDPHLDPLPQGARG